jgi:hypothetical protein
MESMTAPRCRLGMETAGELQAGAANSRVVRTRGPRSQLSADLSGQGVISRSKKPLRGRSAEMGGGRGQGF